MAWQGRRLGSSGPEITTVGFGAWAVGGDWAFGWGPQDDERLDRGDPPRPRRAASTGSTPPPSTGSGTPRRSWRAALESIPAAERPSSSPSAGWSGTRTRPTARRASTCARTPSAGSARPRCAAWAWSASTSTSSTGPTRRARRSRSRGAAMARPRRRGQGAGRRGLQLRRRAARAAARRSCTWTRLQPPFSRSSAGRRPPRSRGAPRTAPASSCTARCMCGLLTGRFSRGADGVARRGRLAPRLPRVPGPNLSRNLALRTRCGPIAERHGASVAAVAVAWTLAWPGVTAAIVGARSPAQVEGWIAAPDLALTGGRPGRDRRGDRGDRRRGRARCVRRGCQARRGGHRTGRDRDPVCRDRGGGAPPGPALRARPMGRGGDARGDGVGPRRPRPSSVPSPRCAPPGRASSPRDRAAARGAGHRPRGPPPRSGGARGGALGRAPRGRPRAPRRAPPAPRSGPRDRRRARRPRRPGGDGHRLGQVALLPGARHRAVRAHRGRVAR